MSHFWHEVHWVCHVPFATLKVLAGQERHCPCEVADAAARNWPAGQAENAVHLVSNAPTSTPVSLNVPALHATHFPALLELQPTRIWPAGQPWHRLHCVLHVPAFAL